MRKLTAVLLLLCIAMICVTSASAYTWHFETPCFTAGNSNDNRISLFATPIVLRSMNYTRYYDSYTPEYVKAPLYFSSPADGSCTVTVSSVTRPSGYGSHIDGDIVFQFIDTTNGREFNFHYRNGETTRFTIPDCTRYSQFELYILPREGSSSSLECYAYVSLCFDGMHKEGELEDRREPATCLKEGTRYIGCTLCGAVSRTEVIPPTGHAMSEIRIIEWPTCTEKGSSGSVCRNCSHTENVISVPALGHAPEKVITSKPGCTDGSYIIRCSICGKQMGKGTEHTSHGHHIVLSMPDAYAPTCKYEGSYTPFCVNCRQEQDPRIAPRLKHRYITTWQDASDDDFFEPFEGMIVLRTCLYCSDQKTTTLPPVLLTLIADLLLLLALVVLIILLIRRLLFCRDLRRYIAQRNARLRAEHS